jgi:hypothetical protein
MNSGKKEVHQEAYFIDNIYKVEMLIEEAKLESSLKVLSYGFRVQSE